MSKDETTFYVDEMERVQQWQYYISSYVRIEHTEGIQRSRLQKVVLERNLPSDAKDSDEGYSPKPLVFQENLIVRICLNSYKMVFEKGTNDCAIYTNALPLSKTETQEQVTKAKFIREVRSDKVKSKMVINNAWMKGLSHDEVETAKNGYLHWKEGDVLEAQDDAADVTMEG